jgi:polyisoprenoid-binding protein YceI
VRIYRRWYGGAAGILLIACATQAQPAEAETVYLDPAQTKVEFTLGDVLHTVHGAFRLAHASVRFDPDTGQASGEVVIDAKSGDSGSEARDGRMKKNVLEVGKYPEIVFLPDRVQGSAAGQGSSHVDVHGLFRIHGTDHELTLPIEVQRTSDQMTMKTHFDVPYVQWGMRNPSSFLLRVDKTVRIDIQAVARVSGGQ